MVCSNLQMFTRKFHRLAEAYPDVTFLEVYGDETKDLRVRILGHTVPDSVVFCSPLGAWSMCPASRFWTGKVTVMLLLSVKLSGPASSLQKLMISMEIRVTPNFRLYRNGELVRSWPLLQAQQCTFAVRRTLAGAEPKMSFESFSQKSRSHRVLSC